ncbi:MAG: hypothetical protein KBD94_06890 [Pyrinomonadaceae bacterium]|nr:hypothetical protein [Pyrinomonadaceae bacterium]
MYVFAQCDHGEQIWRVDFTKTSTDLTVYNFDYLDSHNQPFSRQALKVTNRQILLPSAKNTLPMLVTEDIRKHKWTPLWIGPSQGTIDSLYFRASEGWMVLTGGTVLKSFDGGKSWRIVANLRSVVSEAVEDMAFSDLSIGYVATNGAVHKTTDGGNTWENIDLPLGRKRILVGAFGALIYAGSTGELLRESSGGDWSPFGRVPPGRIDALVVFDSTIFSAINGKVYAAKIK